MNRHFFPIRQTTNASNVFRLLRNFFHSFGVVLSEFFSGVTLLPNLAHTSFVFRVSPITLTSFRPVAGLASRASNITIRSTKVFSSRLFVDQKRIVPSLFNKMFFKRKSVFFINKLGQDDSIKFVKAIFDEFAGSKMFGSEILLGPPAQTYITVPNAVINFVSLPMHAAINIRTDGY